MKKVIVLVVAVLCLTSCGVQTLYNWGPTGGTRTSAYERLAYKNYKTHTPESVCGLVAMYEDLVMHPGGLRQVPPPGVYAEYGYLLIQPETASIFAEHANSTQKRLFRRDDYSAFFKEYGLKLIEKEMECYPESITFLKPLLERFSNM